ncbi:MAG: electron transfer flavoprotein subunit alpha/FixB family protein, partial [Clostridia bacterium]|nr:electron transfer flavoprotein subunit alpha/FixB family protein [Clostridia bacterium]
VNELIKNNNVESQRAYEGEKLKSVWAVGEEVLEKAKEISEEVILIEKSEPQIIYEKALSEKPDVILWNADIWGRKNAPIVAAMLKTGLCADCTMLETDGESLIMYRPAQGGNITAKIKCVTKPQMATVRTKTESFDIIVSGGKGVADGVDKLKKLAETLGAEIGASRGLVDMNKIAYEKQIGLTGKTVSPKIYIAIGISGAIHHTCAIEGSTTVIAINPDKDARIFEYADYGIVERF